jgi:FAD binding domain/Berberine and berberine like
MAFGTSNLVAATARDLSRRIDPQRVLQNFSPNGTHPIWNAAVDHRPAVVVQPHSPREVQDAIRIARDRGLPLSVLGGGHDWAGRSVRDGGLVIDLSEMRAVAVDASGRVATVAGGATAGEVMAATSPFGLVAAAGNVGGVGMAGLTLGGGYGALNGRFGLASDNLVGAEVVLADGRVVAVDANREPELFWALRGGGGNFGVVTSMRLRLHPVDHLIGGLIMFPWSQAAAVWRGLRDVLSTAPDELTVQSGVLPGPDGIPVAYLAPAWSGELAAGQPVVDGLAKLGTPLAVQVAPMTYGELMGLFDAHIAGGLHWAIRTRSVVGYTPEVIDALVEAGSSRTSPMTSIPIHHFHGASTRIASTDTAFANRREHFMIEIVASWEPHDGAVHRAWADAVSASLAPHALPGGYPNLLGPDDHVQIANAYGDNAVRLLAAKAQYDPDGVFTATPLPSTQVR